MAVEQNLRSITFILPPHIYRRLENVLVDNKEVGKIFSKYNSKIKIIPVSIPSEWGQSAFALFKRDKKRKSCLLFPKVEPFSDISGTDSSGQIWDYKRIIFTANQDIVNRCQSIFQDYATQETISSAFTIDDIIEFKNGAGFSTSEIIKRCKIKDPADLDLFLKSFPPLPTNHPVKITTNELQVGDIKILFANLDEKIKPVLIWIGPWGYPANAWVDSCEPINEKLKDTYRIVHIQLSTNTRKEKDKYYTLSRAKQDMHEAIKSIKTFAKEYKIDVNNICLAGVSANAFVATEVASETEGITKLCLLMPLLDLFDAIDALYEKPKSEIIEGKFYSELITRKFYSGKESFIEDFESKCKNWLEFFNAKSSLFLVYDLMYRGAGHCCFKYMAGKLSLLSKNVKICFGSSSSDTLSKYDYLKSEFDSGHYSFYKIPWFHDVKRGVRHVEDLRKTAKKKDENNEDFERLIDWFLDKE